MILQLNIDSGIPTQCLQTMNEPCKYVELLYLQMFGSHHDMSRDM